jgi:hypothetical protein
MSELGVYMTVGFRHIADWRAWDHILFVAALTAAYGPAEWTRIAWLVTAFTIGHSLTLALATFDLVRVPATVVEPLIAATIVITAAFAIRDQLAPAASAVTVRRGWWWRYGIAGGFGLVHGLGFAGGLRSLLGGEASITIPLLGFNLGLEGGQLLVVGSIFLLGVLANRWLGVVRRDWVLMLAGAAGAIGLALVVNRLAG